MGRGGLRCTRVGVWGESSQVYKLPEFVLGWEVRAEEVEGVGQVEGLGGMRRVEVQDREVRWGEGAEAQG